MAPAEFSKKLGIKVGIALEATLRDTVAGDSRAAL